MGWEELDLDGPTLRFSYMRYSVVSFPYNSAKGGYSSFQDEMRTPRCKVVLGNTLRQGSDHPEDLFVVVS